MDAATIQAKIYAGYAKAATYTGFPFTIYRPQGQGWTANFLGPFNPINSATMVGAVKASFTPGQSGFSFTKSAAYKDVIFNGLFDASKTQVGDYLVGVTDIYFIASQQDLLPPQCIRCNATISIGEAGPAKTFGAQTAYGGTTPADETAIMASWPVSMLFDARGRATEVGLPTDLPSPFYAILMPAWPGVDVRSGQFVTDNTPQARRYTIAASELTPQGWRLSAQLAVT